MCKQRTAAILSRRDVSKEQACALEPLLVQAVRDSVQRGSSSFNIQLISRADAAAAQAGCSESRAEATLGYTAFFPYRRLLEQPSPRPLLQPCIDAAASCVVVSEEFYANVYMNCVRKLMAGCSELLAVYDGEGDTVLFAIRYAWVLGIPVYIIDPNAGTVRLLDSEGAMPA